MVWLILFTKTENNIHSWTINSSSTSPHRSNASWGFALNPRPRLRPSSSCECTAALASRSCSTTETWPFAAAKCSGVLPREPRFQGQAAGRTQRNEGEEILRNFGHLKSWRFGNCGHSNCFLNSRNIVVLRRLEDIELVEKHVTFGILLKSCQLIIKLKHTSTLEKKFVSYWDTAKLEIRRLNIGELAYEIQRLRFDSWDLQECKCYIRVMRVETAKTEGTVFWLRWGCNLLASWNLP